MTGPKEYSIDFKDIYINPIDIGRMIGYQENNIPEMVIEKINEIISEIDNISKLKGGYQVFENISCLISIG